MPWIIFDFAGVIGRHQPQEDRDRLLEASGEENADLFWGRYWAQRELYDAGRLSASQYWGLVAPGGDGELLSALDVASWLHPDEETLRLLNELAGCDVGLALLSNCPPDLAAALETLPWLGRLTHRFYSSRYGLVKPDEAIYRTVAEQLGAATGDCIFVDDREPNAVAASRVGMTGIRFTDAATLSRDLAALGASGLGQ